MDRARFEHLLDAYGGDLRRWPESERDAAAAYARDNREALAPQLAAAEGLDRVLTYANGPASPDLALAARILAAAQQTRSVTRRTVTPFAGWALAACALLGLFIGYGAAMAAPAADADDYFAAAFAPPVAPDEPGEPG